MTAKDIFNSLSSLAPQVQATSSVGTYVSNISLQVAESELNRIKPYLPEDSLAFEILTKAFGHYSEKQLWVIAYQLLKSESYVKDLESFKATVKAGEDRKKATRKARSESKKKAAKTIEATQESNEALKVGDEVDLASQGWGKVTAVDSKTITVLFYNGTEKKLIKQFSKLIKL